MSGELPCQVCEHLKACHRKKNRDLGRLLRDFRSFANRMAGSGEGLWISFKRHLRFLKETNFVGEDDRLTPDGVWASKLRLDQPLLIAEAIRGGGFSGLTPELIAGCIAPFVWDRDQDVELRIGRSLELKEIEDSLQSVFESMKAIRQLKVDRGFDNPPILIWPAIALFMWAKGIPWEDLLFHVPVGEGDMASMIIRTADHLRQVTNLKETHPELVSIARSAIDLILREPVFIE
jgi:superfamily II RNA helicase